MQVHILHAYDYDSDIILGVYRSLSKAMAEKDRKTSLSEDARYDEDDYSNYTYSVRSYTVI